MVAIKLLDCCNRLNKMSSYIDKIKGLGEEILALKDDLFDHSTIKKYHPPDGVVYLGNPYSWVDTDEKSHMNSVNLYKNFYEKFCLLLIHATDKQSESIEKSHKRLLSLIELDKKQTPRSTEEAKMIFNKEYNNLETYLDLFVKDDIKTVLIPDTNALIIQPDPSVYSRLVENGRFTFLLTPTVLSELDKLKMFHRDEKVRNKARSVIKRFKGYNQQGDVLEGVIVNKTIRIQMIATEPDLSRTLPWLDKDNMDDRIIASALEVQVKRPSDKIILVSADLNLQNKARLALLHIADADDLE